MKLKTICWLLMSAAFLASFSSCKKDEKPDDKDKPVDPPVVIDDDPLAELLSQKTTGSPLKMQYSDYVSNYKETMLVNFDEMIASGVAFEGCTQSIDKTYQREGKGALRLTINGDYRKTLARLMWRTYGKPLFNCSVKDRKTTTLKLWIFVDNAENIGCDHDKDFGDYPDQATFFFRVFDSKGRVWNWNHTLTGNGWHEVELSFNVHNGYDEDIDFSNIVSFGLLASAKRGTVIELDALRLVEYHTDYVKPQMNPGERLISNAECNALDGAIIQEWYGCSYDLEDKVEGKSSLRNRGDASVGDFRTIIANLDIQLNYKEDVLVFWMKIRELKTVNNIFIELNEVQDTHEYEQNFTIISLNSKGLTQNDTWAKIVIPLSDFKKHLGSGFASGENIILHNFRLVAVPEGSKSFDLHVDNIYVTTKSALAAQ